ncbi:MAG TPA: phosphohistidine phosphatase SixA [Opitutaceae bacterium]|nr:phosphohistidine phosphatase SixA [Opitutaceae bacterium]
MPPLLYLIRHADAEDGADDSARPLSKRGRHQIDELARFLSRSGAFQPAEIWHSPLVRARETADLLRHGLKLHAKHQVVPELTPDSDPGLVAGRLGACLVPLALVGHEPHLGRLASMLVVGRAEPVVFLVKKAAVIALEPGGLRWCVRWHVSPEVIQ